MPILYLTPAALSYLSQFILALLIAGYFIARLLPRRADRPAHRVLLTAFFACIALLTLLLTLEAALPPSERWYAVILQAPVLFLGIILLQQFAYRFPQPLRPKWEAGLALLWSLWHFLDEATFAIGRFQRLAQGEVQFRGNQMDVPIALGLLWVVGVVLRQSLAASARQRTGRPQGSPLQRVLHAMWRPFCDLWRPQGQAARAARALMLVYLLPFGLSLLTILRSNYGIPQELLQLSRSLGIMLALAAFAIVYLNHLPETTSFMVRLVGAMLVTLLTVLAAVGWLVTPAYAAQYRPVFPDGRTLRFTPNAAGGYDLSLAPFHFEADLGASFIKSPTLDEAGRSFAESRAQQDFVFPFFGQTYDRAYANLDGTIALGRTVIGYSDYSYHYGSIPLLMPLLLDLAPEETGRGDAFVRQEADRLIVTWQRVPGFYRREAVFTFQAILYRSGVFEFSYDGLPAELAYRPDDEPSANVWAIGAVPGTSPPTPLPSTSSGQALRGEGSQAPPSLAGTSPPTPLLPGEGRLAPPSLAGKGVGGLGPQYVDLASLAAGGTISSGPAGLVQDYYLDFRKHLHTLLLPLATLMLGVTLLMLLAFPWLFRLNLVKPLETLLAGVRRVNAGDLETAMPIQYRDEIGFLTESFNSTAAKLRDLIATLEARVAERTQALRVEMAERQAAQAQVLVQERALAAAEEREQLGRELHDGLGQVMSYLNLQAQTVEALLDQGKTEGVRTNLHQMAQAAQQAHTDVRSFILGFRAAARRSFGEALQDTAADFERQAGIPILLEAAQPWDARWLSPVAEVHLLRIIQEALNNVRKHAQAQHVTLSLAQAGDRLRVTVADDGVGFDLTPSTPPSLAGKGDGGIGHFGLANMHERAAELCGSLVIESAPGRGTRVILECPIQTPCGPATVPVRPQRVLLVDDHPMFLDGLRNLLTAHGMEVVGLGQDGLEAQTLARALRPDLIVMDLHMPNCDGLEATRRIKAEWPDAAIVILTVSAAEEDLFAALQAGAAGYLLKNLNAEEFFLLLAQLDQAAPPIAPELAARIRGELGQATLQRGLIAALSPTESELLRLVAQGLTYREVGRQLHVSEAAVKYHMKQILERLHLANRAQAEAYARRSGLGGDAVMG